LSGLIYLSQGLISIVWPDFTLSMTDLHCPGQIYTARTDLTLFRTNLHCLGRISIV